MGDSSTAPELAEAQGAPLEGHPLSMRSLLAEAVEKEPGSKAVVSLFQRPESVLGIGSNTNQTFLTWTYDQLNKEADRLAASLWQRGISQGARVAVFLFNGAEWALLFWACVKLGATFVPLDPRSVSRVAEARHYLKIVKPVVLVVGDELAAEAMQRTNAAEVDGINLKLVADLQGKLANGWTNLKDIFLAPDQLHPGLTAIKEIKIDMDQDVFIFFTSGTSSLPKACPHNNTNLWVAWAATAPYLPAKSSDLLLQHLPSSHIFACVNMMSHWIVGAAVVYPSRSFDAGATLNAIKSLQCTHMSAIPGLLLALLGHPFFKPEMVKSLTRVMLAGTVISPEVLLAATHKSKLGATTATVSFGMSEGLAVAATSTDGKLMTEGGFLGLDEIFRGTRIKICKAGTRRVLERGEIGELHFGGRMRIRGYLDGDNSCFYDDDGVRWISTGDQAKMDVNGTIYVLGRYKDIIIRAGENLSPVSIETSLNKAGVMAQVVGVPDEISGEVPLAVVQPLRPGPLPIEDMQRYVELDLGQAKMPTAFLSLEDLGIQAFPSTTSGKIRKQELRQMVLAHLTTQQQQQQNVDIPQSLMVTKPNTQSTESALLQILSSLIGQHEQSIPRDKPIHELTDSINILRFQAAIWQRLHKNITISDIMRADSIKDVAELVTLRPGSQHIVGYAPKRKGPPQTDNVVHVQGDGNLLWHTRRGIEPILSKLNFTWSEVEDIFPIPDLSIQTYETTRPLAFSIRSSFLSRSASRDQLCHAIEATLQQWEMFRSIAVTIDNRALFVTLRASEQWSKTVITEKPDLKTPQDIPSLGRAHGENINVDPRTGGPLARFFLADIESTGTAGLLLVAHHSIFDAQSMPAFFSDLESHLANNPPTGARTPYKLYADMYFQHSTSLPAQISIAFHANRLRGVSSSQKNLWPPQRCIGWHIGDDHGYQVSPTVAAPTFAQERVQIDNDRGFTGLIGITTLTRLEDLSLLRTEHQISPPVLFKAALAMLNAHLSGTPEAVFANTQAGRTWPFIDGAVAEYLPPPITIAGSTLAIVMNRIGVYGYETTGEFLKRLEAEQQALTTHAHAPFSSIASQLNAADAAVFKAGNRQVLDWNLSPLAENSESQAKERELRLLQIEGLSETMIQWHGGLAGPDVINLTLRWDGAQFGKAEVEGWASLFVKAMIWLAAAENWERKIDDFVW